LKAVDQNKDQTYFLYTLKKEQLSRIIFPVGDLEKSEVRKLAKKFGLENAEKKDSQGVCFIGPLNMKHFLKSYIKRKLFIIIF
jgi:tRNA-specific 2-thiouridylase